MRINLTLLLQLFNVMITIWMVRKIFWPSIFGILEQEKMLLQKKLDATDELNNKIQATETNQLKEEIALTQLIQKTLRETRANNSLTSKTTYAETTKKTPYPRTHHQPSTIDAANKLIHILQSKF